MSDDIEKQSEFARMLRGGKTIPGLPQQMPPADGKSNFPPQKQDLTPQEKREKGIIDRLRQPNPQGMTGVRG